MVWPEHTGKHSLCLPWETHTMERKFTVYFRQQLTLFCLCVGTQENVWLLKTAHIVSIVDMQCKGQWPWGDKGPCQKVGSSVERGWHKEYLEPRILSALCTQPYRPYCTLCTTLHNRSCYIEVTKKSSNVESTLLFLSTGCAY